MFCAIGFLIILGYYIFVWDRIGRDPKGGVIVPLFHPPKGLTPAGAHYLLNQSFTDKTFSVAIIGLAVKGALQIQETYGGFRLEKQPWNTKRLSAGEQEMMNALFMKNSALDITPRYRDQLSKARIRMKMSMDLDLDDVMFQTNRSHLMIGALLSICLVAVAVSFASDAAGMDLIALAFGAWTFGCAGISIRAYKIWRNFQNNPGRLVPALASTAFTIPFWLVEFYGIKFLAFEFSMIEAFLIFASFMLTPLFLYLLKTPSQKGRKLMDQIEGFRLYLSVSEVHKLAQQKAPHISSDLFETYLPYAIALDVPVEWGRQFDNDLSLAASRNSKKYRPIWYSSTTWGHKDFASFGNSLRNAFTDDLHRSAGVPNSEILD